MSTPYRISSDREDVDTAVVHDYLSNHSYWAAGIPLDVVARSIEHSICFSAFDGEEQVGFARVITDEATYGYLADVFVLESHRGLGLATLLMESVLSHPSLKALRRWQLVTRDAHPFYARFGFHASENPERHMELVIKNAYVS